MATDISRSEVGDQHARLRTYYDDRHSAQNRDTWRPPDGYVDFLRHLNVKPNGRLLDIGCGTGHLLRAASDRGVRTFGLDISTIGTRIAKGVSPRSAVLAATGQALPYRNQTFDYVTCIGVLEHFPDIPGALSEIRRVAKADARCCIVVPNASYLLWNLRGKRGTEQQDVQETLHTLEQWRDLFAAHRLQVLSVDRDLWPGKAAFAGTDSMKSRLKALGLKIFFSWHPLKWTYQFVFILAPS